MANIPSTQQPTKQSLALRLLDGRSFSRDLTASLILAVVVISGIVIPLFDFVLDSIVPSPDHAITRLFFPIALVAVASAVALTLVTNALLRRFLERPLKELGEIVRFYASGQYDVTMPNVAYVEFQALASLLGDMGNKINSQLKELKQAEDKYRNIFQRASEGIFQVTPEGCILSANPALARILGYASADELIASVNDIVQQILAQPERRQQMLDLIQRGQAVAGLETQMYRKDRSVIWISVHASFVYDEQHTLRYIEGLVTDITERKAAEEKLRIYRQHLEDLVEQRTAELRRINQQLEQEIVERKQAEEALQRAHADLEQRVAERTAELVQTNEQLNQEIVERKRAQAAEHGLSVLLEQRVADRTRELSALYGVSSVASRAENLETLLDKSLELTMSAMRGDGGAILLLDEAKDNNLTRLRVAAQAGKPFYRMPRAEIEVSEGGVADSVLRQRETLLIPDLTTDPRVSELMRRAGSMSLLLAPLRAEGKVLGMMGMLRSAGQTFNVEEVALLTTVADQIGISTQRLQLRELAQQNALLEERQRLARDMHDSVTQYLYGLVTLTEAAEGHLEASDLPSTKRILTRVEQTARQALKELRLFIHQLRPRVLAKEGLVGALQLRLAAVEGRSDVRTRILVDENINLPHAVEEALYQISQEALNNVLRHACATSVVIRLNRNEDYVILEVADDGCGFDLNQVGAGGMGMTSMRELAEEVGGTLQVVSEPFGGTQVKVTVKV